MTQDSPPHPVGLDEIFDELRNLPKLYALPEHGDTQSRLQHIHEQFREGHYPRYFEELGISIAGFVYIDPTSKKVHYAFFAEARGTSDDGADDTPEDVNRIYMIGYEDHGWRPVAAPKSAKEPHAIYARVIDTLFFVHRYLQQNFQSDPEAALPEYITCMPPHDDPRHVTKLDDAIRTDFGIHYVPYGEMTAFLLMWRRLTRRAGQGEIDWDSPSWHRWGARREALVLRVRNGDRLGALAADAGDNLRDIMQPIDGGDAGDAAWRRDLADLLLVEQDHDRWGKILAEATEPLRRFAEDIGVLLAPGAPIDQVFADRLIQRICGIDPEEPDPRQLTKALDQLHDKSRFPILPYYYWSAISRRPRSHAVVPVWASISSPLQSPVQTAIVGLAVVDVYPLEHLDKSFLPTRSRYAAQDEQPDAKKIQELERKRLRLICSSLRLIAQPQVDSFYYSQIQGRNIRKQESRSIAYNLTHDAKARVAPLSNILNSDRAEGEKVRMCLDLVDSLRERITNVSQFSSLPDYTVDVLTEEYSDGKSISLKQFIAEEFVEALLSFILRESSAAWELLDLFGLKMDEFDRDSAKLIADKIIKSSNLELFKVVSEYKLAGTYVKSMYTVGLSIILSEIYENFLKHDLTNKIINSADASPNILDSIRVRASVIPNKEIATGAEPTPEVYKGTDLELCTIRLEFEPGGRVVPEKLDSWAGLHSLSYTALKLGIRVPEKSFLCRGTEMPLPFWDPQPDEGSHAWELRRVTLLRLPS